MLFSNPNETDSNRKRPTKPTPAIAFFFNLYLCSMAGGLVCLFCYVFSSKVYEINSASQYNENDYFLYYKDVNEKYHIVVPFTNYIYNNSNHRVKVTPVYYGSHRYKSHQENGTEIYNCNVFRRLINNPNYVFETPPEVIRVKGHSRGTTRYVLNYE